jgi:hypothetical protein
MTTIALTPEGEAFLARVREELDDLPPDERDELLEDIEAHLAEVAGEGEVALAARLGSAEEFARELRTSAGLPPRTAPSVPSRLNAVGDWFERCLRRGRSLGAHVDARLLWLIARGWLLTVAAAVAIGHFGHTYPWGRAHAWLPHPGIRGNSAALVLLALIALSLLLGRRAARGRDRLPDRVLTVLALIAVAPAAWHMDSPPRSPYFSTPQIQTQVEFAPTPGLAFDGVPIANVFPFDRSGKPLNDVLLYLPDGRALNVDASRVDPHRRYLVTRRGNRVYNSFPVRYYEPGTTRVAHPTAGPSVHVPNVLTPPLGSRAS